MRVANSTTIMHNIMCAARCLHSMIKVTQLLGTVAYIYVFTMSDRQRRQKYSKITPMVKNDKVYKKQNARVLKKYTSVRTTRYNRRTTRPAISSHPFSLSLSLSISPSLPFSSLYLFNI